MFDIEVGTFLIRAGLLVATVAGIVGLIVIMNILDGDE